jgi:hypothetical protein
MAANELIDPAALETGDPVVRHDVECFWREERFINEFKDEGRTPYMSSGDIARTKVQDTVDGSAPTEGGG